MEEKLSRLYSVAKAYYEDNATQDAIARAVGVSRSQVSRYLSEARELGIVHVRVISPDDRDGELEAGLKAAFPGLKDATVVPLGYGDMDAVRHLIGRAASRYLQTHLQNGDRLGIGAGRTVRQAVRWLKPAKATVTVVQIIGSVGYHALDIDYNELARETAKALGAPVYFLNAPAIIGKSFGTAQQLIDSNQTIARTVAMSQSCSVYLLGLGSVQSTQMYTSAGLLSAEDIAEAAQGGAVGNICASFIRLDGSPCAASFDDRVVGVGLTHLKRARLSIGVAGGEDKVQPIVAALRGGYINVLITNESTARKVLDYVDSEQQTK